MFDFDREIDRSGTMSLKWDKYKGQDVLPMWVADTDFASPPRRHRSAHGAGGPRHLRLFPPLPPG